MTLPAPAPLLLTDGDLALRPLGADDGWLEQALAAEPDVVRYTMYPDGMSPELSAERLERYAGHYAAGRVARYVFVLDGAAVGIGGVGAAETGDQVEVFYALLPHGRGRGAASRGARLLASWAHAAGATATLSTHDDNVASQQVAARAGFVRCGEEVREVKGIEARLLLWRWAPADFQPSGNQGERPDLYDLENAALDREGLVLAAMRELAPWAGRDLLDLGCGSGWWLPAYADEARSVTGVEPDPRLVPLAASRDPRARVLSGSAEHIPLPDASVDVVHARFAYFFPPGCDAGLAEVLRVLRPGGTLVVVDNDTVSGDFAGLLRASAWAAPQGISSITDGWWAERGAARTAVLSSWRFDARADLEAVLRLEFPAEVADPWLAAHPTALGLAYGYVLFAVRRPSVPQTLR